MRIHRFEDLLGPDLWDRYISPPTAFAEAFQFWQVICREDANRIFWILDIDGYVSLNGPYLFTDVFQRTVIEAKACPNKSASA